jgi:hypothetical protein
MLFTGQKQAGWRHAILKFILISSIIKALSSLGGDFFFFKEASGQRHS